ncbi:MAG: NUDIX domain-containing protein [Candidatus Magasanikbacteria bacterium]
MIKQLTSKQFKQIFSAVPRLCVEVIIQSNKGVILTKRTIPPAIGFWHVPGGTVLKGEKLEAAVVRVAKSELGLKVKVIKFLGVIQYSFKNYFGSPVGLAYSVKIIGGKFNFDKKVASDAKFFKKLPNNTIPEQKKFITKHIKL